MPALSLFDPGPEDDPGQPLAARTVEQLFKIFTEAARASDRYSARTWAARQPIMDRFVAAFRTRRPETIRPIDLEHWVHSQPGWKAQATRRGAFDAVAVVFAWGAKKEVIAKNPLANADRPREGKRRDDMKPHEFRALILVATATVRRIMYFAGWAGCRPGEWSTATWPQIDWTAGREKITLEEHKTAKKTGKPRVIPLTPKCLRLLRWLQARAADLDGLILLNSAGRQWQKSHWVQTMTRMCDRAGIKRRGWHMIRHMFGTQRIRAGKPIKLVSLAMGHASVAITEKYYCHLDDEIAALQQAMLEEPTPPRGK